MYDIYSNANNDAWRFTLGKSGTRTLIVIGLNPSTATQERADTTVAKVEQAAANNGYDGFIMLNLYPVRSTDFESLPLEEDTEAFRENMERIVQLVATTPNPVIWAAWGESIRAREYFQNAACHLIAKLSNTPAKWVHFGPLTQSGHPRHPSRLQYAWGFNDLDVKQYTHTLKEYIPA